MTGLQIVKYVSRSQIILPSCTPGMEMEFKLNEKGSCSLQEKEDSARFNLKNVENAKLKVHEIKVNNIYVNFLACHLRIESYI